MIAHFRRQFRVSRATIGIITALVCMSGCSQEAARSPNDQVTGAHSPHDGRSDETTVARVDLATLSGRLSELPLRRVVVADPVYLTDKRYEGYPLRDVVRTAFGDAIETHPDGELKFICSDAYSPTLPLRRLDHRATLAVRDLDAPAGKQWQTFEKERQTVSPAPYYVVWSDVPARLSERFPWPYNLVALELHSEVTSVPVSPDGAALKRIRAKTNEQHPR